LRDAPAPGRRRRRGSFRGIIRSAGAAAPRRWITMPELPEVETVARQLANLVVGRRAGRLVVFDPKLDAAARRDLSGLVANRVFRLGKQVVVEFAPEDGASRSPEWLAVHLRMTGRLIWSCGAVRPVDTRAALELDGGEVWFADTRRFGTLTWHRSLASAAPAGLDPTSADFTREALARLLAGRRQQMKTWLLRQDRLVGLGNIYASEILHRARISPFRKASSLKPDEVARLFLATRRVIGKAIEHCGTTFSDFQDARGVAGGFWRFLQVYDRAGEPCRRCRTPIRRVVQQQRSTYYCPGCTRAARGPKRAVPTRTKVAPSSTATS